ncbi:glycosyltransferase, partial [Fischerella thermalis WC246]
MKTIGMISSYRALEKQGDWLWQQTPHPFGVWGNIQMQALANKPDFLLMYQFNFPKTPRKKSWLDRFRRQKKSEVKVEAFLRGVPKERIIYLLREP